MKSSINKYVLAEIKRNKRSSISNFICYTLFIFIAIITGTLSKSFETSYRSYITNTYGTYSGYFYNIGQEGIKKISSDERISSAGRMNLCGYTNEYINFVDFTTIGTFDDTALNQVSLTLIEGRLPEAANEIAVEEVVYFQMKDKLDSNDTIELTYLDFNDNQITKTYHVVGIISNYTSFQSRVDFSDKHTVIPEMMLPSIIVSSSDESTSTQNLLVTLDADFGFKEEFEFFDEYNTNYSVNYHYNTGRAESSAASVVHIFNAISILSILLGLAFLIGSFVLEKKRLLERSIIMKCSGMTNRVLLRFHVLKSIFLLLPAIVFGTVLSVPLSILLIKYFLAKKIEYIEYHMSAFNILIPFVLAFLLIILLALLSGKALFKKRPLEVKSGSNTKATTIRFKHRFFIKHPVLCWGLKSAYFYSYKYVSLIVCLAFAMFSFVIIQLGVISEAGKYETSKMYDYSLNISEGTLSGICWAESNFDKGIRVSDIDSLKKSGEVEKLLAYTSHYVHIIDDETFPEGLLNKLEYDYFLTEEQFLSEKLSYGYSDYEVLYRSHLILSNQELLNELLDAEEITLGSNEVIVITEDEKQFNKGQTIKFTQPIPDSEDKFYRKDAELTVGAIINASNSQLSEYFYERFGVCFLIKAETSSLFPFNNKFRDLQITLKDKGVYGETEKVISSLRLMHELEQIKVNSNREVNNQKQIMIITIYTIGGIIEGILLIYCILNINKILLNKLYEQRKTWGILRAGGLSEKKAVMVNLSEICAISIVAWILAFVILAALILLTVPDMKTLGKYMKWSVVVATLPISFIIFGFQVWITVRSFWKTKVVSLIRHE